MSTASIAIRQQPFEPDKASAGSHLAPVRSFNSLLDLPGHHRRHKDTHRHHAARKAREYARLEDTNSEAAVCATARAKAEQASRDVARSYLEGFLETSEWQDHVDLIGIIDEAVPTMEELESYRDLDEAEGTRACRKMFKAVVVWEQVGHSLWERLRDDARKAQKADKPNIDDAAMPPSQPCVQPEEASRWQSPHRALGSRELNALSVIMEQPSESQKKRRSSLTALTAPFSRGRKSSLVTQEHHAAAPTPTRAPRPSGGPRRSSSVPVSRKRTRELNTDYDCCKYGQHDGPRRATDPGPTSRNEWPSDESTAADTAGEAVVKAAATFPKKVSKGCANAVRRTFEALHDPRGKHAHGKRRASTVY